MWKSSNIKVAVLIILMWGATWGTGRAQSPYWAQRAGGATTDEAMDISIDADGNTYTTGYFSASSAFGATTLSSSGVTDAFICKTDPSGFFQWAIKAGGTGSDRSLSIKTDASGNSYITGFFYGTATFGTQTLVSTGVQDVFVAKYDNSGAFVWATSAGGAGSDIGNGINVDNAGNVVITGEFAGTATFGSQTLTSMNGSVDIFTAKLDANGNFLWAKKGSAHLTDRGIDVACDPSGNVYVTGQFTDTITFDNTHLNNTYNAIFVVKYNSSGSEQWFRRIGAGTMNVVHGIAVDVSSNVYLTGDFSGNVIFFGSPNVTLSEPYPNGIFLAKYSSSGSLLWTASDGSDSEVSSRNLALDNSDNPFIVGNFKCKLGSYADEYGEGTFNSVGFWDVFATKYNTGGQWQWSRSLGGRKDDLGNGITVNSFGQPVIAGSYVEKIFLPIPDDFEMHSTDTVLPILYAGYCGDSEYRQFRKLIAAGNSDAYIAKIFDTARAPFDYYRRQGSACDRPFVGVCIGGNTCPDTLTFCSLGVIRRYSNVIGVGPDFTYQWSNGSTGFGIQVGQTGNYWVTQSSVDGCFVSEDTIHVIINPNPPTPLISDNVVVNNQALNPDEIQLCSPDSVLLTGSGYGIYEPHWAGPVVVDSDSVWASIGGIYSFYYQDGNGCLAGNNISVNIDSLYPIIVPEMDFQTDEDGNDSITVCEGESFAIHVFDTITDPTGLTACIEDAEVAWLVTPTTIEYLTNTPCMTPFYNEFFPEESGNYLIQATVIRINHCDTDIVQITRSIYVELHPLPNISPIDMLVVGNNHICPGDSTLLIASQAPNYVWIGPGVDMVENDSIWLSLAGLYTVYSSLSDSNEYGCIASEVDTVLILINVASQPEIVTTPGHGVICPQDSVILSCNGIGLFQWEGPAGPFGANNPLVTVNTAGTYYCIRTDQYGCEIVSNSVEVEQYATPFILTGAVPILCEGAIIELTASTNPGSTLEWQPPLSGSNPVQTINQPGIYTCLIASCGIQTPASIEVVASEVMAEVTVVGLPTVCEGDSVILQANDGQTSYQWNPNGGDDTEWVVYESGTYSLTTFDANDCSIVSAPVTVTIVENTLMPPLVKDTAICLDGYAELVATANGTIYWYDDELTESPIEIGPVYITPNLSDAVTYYVQQKSMYCESDKAPVHVTIDDCEGIEVSNVFTPNGDGVNDVFYFPQKGGTCFRCRIYSRWGRLLYEWEDQNQGWDGTIQVSGALVNDGVYYYLLDFCDYAEKPIREAGFLHVLGSR